MRRTPSSDLDLFILALVRSGLATAYDLKSKAGLSVGSTTPVLRRLKKAGLISGSKPGARGSRKFEVTPVGIKTLDSGWRSAISVPSDFDSTLRAIYLAWLFGDSRIVSKVIEKSVSAQEQLALVRAAEAAQLKRADATIVTGKSFRWLRAVCSAAELRARANVLRDIAKILPKKSKQ
jgi:DNA-binding PadR family transcriptional regulator